MPLGKLKVCLRNAVLQEDATITETRTLFCILKVGSQEFSTGAEGGAILSFSKRRFEFQVDDTMRQATLNIFIKKNLEDNDFLVYCSINFTQLLYTFNFKLKSGKRNIYPRPVYQMTRASVQEGGLINFHVTYKDDVQIPYARAVEIANQNAEVLTHVPSMNRLTNEEDSSSGDDSHDDNSLAHHQLNSIYRPPQAPRGAPVNGGFVASSSGYAQLPAPLGYDEFPAGSGYAPLPYFAIPEEDLYLHKLTLNNNNDNLLENVGGTSIQDVGEAPMGLLLKPDGEVSEELIEQIETSSYGSAAEELSDYEGGSSGEMEAGYYSDGKGGRLINFQ